LTKSFRSEKARRVSPCYSLVVRERKSCRGISRPAKVPRKRSDHKRTNGREKEGSARSTLSPHSLFLHRLRRTKSVEGRGEDSFPSPTPSTIVGRESRSVRTFNYLILRRERGGRAAGRAGEGGGGGEAATNGPADGKKWWDRLETAS